ncbi:MAG: hypothetical protein JWP36_10 [Paucimonas sp.]|nr:hypothetical protein [Paucimonas sp.]
MRKQQFSLRLLSLALLTALAWTGPAAAQSASTTDQSSSKPAQAAGSTQTKEAASSGTSGKGSPMRRADQKMLGELAQANMAEVKTGEVALKKSQNADVKAFAQKMVDEHGAALKEVQTLADSKGVTLPKEPDAKHRGMMATLDKLSPERFDKMYIEQGGVSDHKKTHKLVQDIQAKAKDVDLKALAAKLQPAIDKHLEIAQSMKAKPASASSGAGGASSGASGGASSSGKSDAGSK